MTSRTIGRLRRYAAGMALPGLILFGPDPGTLAESGMAAFEGGISGVHAQEPETPGPPPMYAGGSISIAQPRGEFADYVDLGFGISGFFRVPLDEAQFVSIRIDASGLTYGNETQRVCLVQPCLVQVDLTTSNNIVLGSIGPEVAIPLIGGLDLYSHVGGGFSYFATTSSVEDLNSQETIASDQNFSDFGLAWKAGGGLRLGVWRGQTPVALDLGLEYQGNGRREYLTAGDISENPDGSLRYDVRRSDADFLLWRIGVSVGIHPDS